MNFAFSQRRAYPVLLTLLLLLLFGADPAAAHPTERPLQTNVCGAITANTTWTTANSPYIMTCSVTVNAGVTLTIQAGVTVMGTGSQRLEVQGRLVTNGTAANRVVFTSQTNNGIGQWRGILFNGGTGHLKYTIVRYAGNFGVPNIEVLSVPTGGEVRIENSEIAEAADYAMWISTTEMHQVVLNNNMFVNNILNRILLRGLVVNTSATLVPQTGLDGYALESYLTINTGVTLTMQPGAVLMGAGSQRLEVKGHLVANGTAANPVVFTSQANNGIGQWRGVVFNGGTGHLNHTIVRYAGNFGVPNIEVLSVPTGGEVRIENSEIAEAADYAMWISTTEMHQVVLNNNMFVNNILNRILLRGLVVNTSATLVPQTGLDGYALESYLTINTGVTLTMQPGAVLMGAGSQRLEVKGHLVANGTAANPVVFTSQANNGPGQWRGVVFNGGAGHLNHTIVRYAGNFGVPSVEVIFLPAAGEVLIENSQLRESAGDGIYIRRDRVTLNCVRISENEGDGIEFASGVNAPIFAMNNSRIENNLGNGILNNNALQIDARNTWWGDPSGPGGSGPGVGDEVSGNVLFNPWLTTSPSSGCVDTLYVSSSTGGTVGGVAFGDEDILALDPAGPDWNMLFDGSDVGIPTASDVDAFDVLPNGTLLMSFDITTTLPGIGMVMDADVVRFTPTDLGDVTAGSFSWYLDGSDVGLTTVGEDIDALDLAPDGRLVVSTLGTASVPGATALDEDLLVFNATQLGATTQGTWQLFFDGSDVALTDVNEDVWGVWLDDLTQDVYLSTLGNFTTSDGVTGDDDDIFICHPTGLGSNTACTFDFFWNGALYGFGPETLDGFASSRVLGRPAANPAAAAADAATVITDGSDDAFNGDVDDGPASEVEQTPSTEGDAADDNAEEIQQRNLFLPLVAQQ